MSENRSNHLMYGEAENRPSGGLLFHDDFSARQLDPSRWNIRVSGPTVNNELQAYLDSPQIISTKPAQDAEGNTVLAIQPRYQPNYSTPEGDQRDFISGRIDTKGKFQFKYGTASARISTPVGSGFWPAFWAMGDGTWPDNGEIDIMENVGIPDWVSAGIHGPGYSGESGLINQIYLDPSDDISAWHIYSVDWFPDQLLFKVDGKLIYRVTQAMVGFFGTWVFAEPKYLILNLALGGKYPHKINGITTPYYGLSQETFKIIQEDKARMLIDWVKVTKYE